MKGLRLRGVVLAAGFGQRLRPLTETFPKPLLPVAGKPVLVRTLEQLATVGCEAIAVNLHHLGGEIEDRVGGEVAGVPITYSPEEPILGTLGALAPLAEFLAPADLVLLVNGDSLTRWPLKRLVKVHLKSGARATLLASRFADPARFGGGIAIGGGRVLALRGRPRGGEEARRAVFAGAHVFAPELVAGGPIEPADIVTDLYQPLLAESEPLAAVGSRRPWYDLGTPRRYLDAALDAACGRWIGRWLRRSWTSGPRPSEVTLRRSVVESDVEIGAGARIERSLLLPGVKVGPGSVVRDSILGFDAELPPETNVEARLITPQRAGSKLADGDSVVGGMIYTPIGAGRQRAH